MVFLWVSHILPPPGKGLGIGETSLGSGELPKGETVSLPLRITPADLQFSLAKLLLMNLEKLLGVAELAGCHPSRSGQRLGSWGLWDKSA